MRLGHLKPPSLQSQPVTCYSHDLNPGCISRLHEPELPHRGEERVLASTRICLQASPLDPLTTSVSCHLPLMAGPSDLATWGRSALDWPGPKPFLGSKETQYQSPILGRPKWTPTLAILFHPGGLWSNDQLSKFRLMVTGLRLGAPHPSSQKQCTREDVSGTERSLRSTTLVSLASASGYSHLPSCHTHIPSPCYTRQCAHPSGSPVVLWDPCSHPTREDLFLTAPDVWLSHVSWGVTCQLPPTSGSAVRAACILHAQVPVSVHLAREAWFSLLHPVFTRGHMDVLELSGTVSTVTDGTPFLPKCVASIQV